MKTYQNPNGFERSYEMIVDTLLTYSTSMCNGVCGHVSAPQMVPNLVGFVHEPLSAYYDLQVGDLCLVVGHFSKDFRLCWFKGYVPDQDPDRPIFVLQSAKTGDVREWAKVGISPLNRFTLSRHPEWRFTNRQHEIADLWADVTTETGSVQFRGLTPIFDGDIIVLTLVDRLLDRASKRHVHLLDTKEEVATKELFRSLYGLMIREITAKNK